ncbi:MAG: hypothetical protein ABI728_14925, partial [Betaproteobacteria bacterium]
APRQVELRSRPIEAGSTGAPPDKGARHQGRPSFGYFSWPRKKSDQPPGCPRLPFLTHNYFHPPIFRFGHVAGSFNQRLALAAPGGLDDFRGNSALGQQVFYPDGALQGKRVVVLIAADENGNLPPA